MVEVVEVVKVVGIFCDCFLDILNLCVLEDFVRFNVMLKRLMSCKEEFFKFRVILDNSFFVLFVLCELGEYLISIKKYGFYVKNSFFSVMVVVFEIGNVIGRLCGVGFEILGLKFFDDYIDGFLSVSFKWFFGKFEEFFFLVFNLDNILSVFFML